jgi:hypothetical protein
MTYASRLRSRLDPQHPCNQSFGKRSVLLPDEYYEKQYQQMLTGGFSTKRICPTCRVALPKTNRCDYC